MKTPALRVIKARIEALVSIENTKQEEADREACKKAANALRKNIAEVRVAMLNMVAADPAKYFTVNATDSGADLRVRPDGIKALEEMFSKDFPARSWSACSQLHFPALALSIHAHKRTVAKFKRLAEQIDEAMLDDDAQNIVALLANFK